MRNSAGGCEDHDYPKYSCPAGSQYAHHLPSQPVAAALGGFVQSASPTALYGASCVFLAGGMRHCLLMKASL